MSGLSSAKFSASDAAVGYLYQVRVALLWALRRLRSGSDFMVSLETLDDVTFEANGEPTDILQTKHHQVHAADLTDSSPDLWKSLRIWFEGRLSGSVPGTANLHLLTTAAAASGSVAEKLRTSGRDVEAALKSLVSTAQSSTSQKNAEAYKVFLGTPTVTRRAILDAVIVEDAAPNIVDLDADLRTEVFWACERENHDAFLARLEGWWFRRTLKQLTSPGLSDRIPGEEIEAQMSDLREQFKEEALPIDDDLLSFTLDDATRATHADSRFVFQLEIANAGKKRIAAAIRDYYRAYEQRSRWLRDRLLYVGELGQYERKLVEEWELVFEAMKDEIGANATEAIRTQAAREVLSWAERATIPIRPAVVEPFITRGSLHMLADDARVGWHPDFVDRLTKLLQNQAGGSP